MLENYSHKYKDGGGHLIFVPNDDSCLFGCDLIKRILKRWQPPVFCYHFPPGGHIAAAQAHLPNTMFVRMDIQRFFDSVTRSKVHRSLRYIGIPHRRAFEAAQFSTVSKSKSGRRPPYSVPFGFVQSPMLATLALMTSALGNTITAIHSGGKLTISVYMDDVLLSGDCATALEAAKAALEAAAATSGFAFNLKKASGPAASVTVFNLIVRHGDMELTSERFTEFELDIADDLIGYITGGIIGYVSTVNAVQAAALSVLLERLRSGA